ncbi:unnamed protein product [Citrullus colocynthis]|uniref:Uncharacterized protein n=1 Tax=Citrullus colocynthis TaxID=252529 RepID=A0ABP0YCN4_9ROSI
MGITIEKTKSEEELYMIGAKSRVLSHFKISSRDSLTSLFNNFSIKEIKLLIPYISLSLFLSPHLLFSGMR